MRTVYDLYRWTTDGGTAEPAARYATLADAITAAGYPELADWTVPAAGGWGLRRDLAEELGYRQGQPWHISEEREPDTDAERIELALEFASDYGQIDGAHHKAWTIDQMTRVLLGDRYERFVADYREDGEYTWDKGIAP